MSRFTEKGVNKIIRYMEADERICVYQNAIELTVALFAAVKKLEYVLSVSEGEDETVFGLNLGVWDDDQFESVLEIEFPKQFQPWKYSSENACVNVFKLLRKRANKELGEELTLAQMMAIAVLKRAKIAVEVEFVAENSATFHLSIIGENGRRFQTRAVVNDNNLSQILLA